MHTFIHFFCFTDLAVGLARHTARKSKILHLSSWAELWEASFLIKETGCRTCNAGVLSVVNAGKTRFMAGPANIIVMIRVVMFLWAGDQTLVVKKQKRILTLCTVVGILGYAFEASGMTMLANWFS